MTCTPLELLDTATRHWGRPEGDPTPVWLLAALVAFLALWLAGRVIQLTRGRR